MGASKKISGIIAAAFMVGSAPATGASLSSPAPVLAPPTQVTAQTEGEITTSGITIIPIDDNTCWKVKDAERRFTRKINAERGLKSLGKLSLDPELSKAARVHTWAMARKDDLYHTPSETLRRRVTNWTVLGENVGVGGGVRSLHDAFMNSPAHKENVLYTTFAHVGVGVVERGGRMWVTVIFEAIADPGTTLPMPRC